MFGLDIFFFAVRHFPAANPVLARFCLRVALRLSCLGGFFFLMVSLGTIRRAFSQFFSPVVCIHIISLAPFPKVNRNHEGFFCFFFFFKNAQCLP
jgi:hypothetical protein